LFAGCNQGQSRFLGALLAELAARRAPLRIGSAALELSTLEQAVRQVGAEAEEEAAVMAPHDMVLQVEEGDLREGLISTRGSARYAASDSQFPFASPTPHHVAPVEAAAAAAAAAAAGKGKAW
jgi:hypothetical protein